MTTGLQSAGQIVVTSSTTLGVTQAGYNMVIGGGPGVTLTFPSTVETFSLNNIGANPVSLVYPAGSDFGPTLYPGRQVILAGDGNGYWRVVASSIPTGSIVSPYNDWPDPQFCIQDANVGLPAKNDVLTGTISLISYSGNTTGSSTVVVTCSDTSQLLADSATHSGSLIYFSSGADTALLGNGLYRVTAITPNTNFTIVGEAYWLIPSTSTSSTVHVQQRGQTSSTGSGAVTSNVSRLPSASGSAPTVWISERPAHTSLLNGCARVLVVTLTSSPSYIFWQPSQDRLRNIQGTMRSVGLAAYVANGAGAQAQAYIDNGTVSAGGPVATAASRTWLTTYDVIGTSVYQAGVVLTGAVGSTFVLGEFTECASFGPLPDGSFSTPRAQIVKALASLSPWVGETITVPSNGKFTVDFKQISQGVINEGVSYNMGLLEGQSTVAGDILSSSDAGSPPIIYNPILHQINTGADSSPNFYAFCSGNFNMDHSARMYFSGTAGHTWKHLSWDIHGAVLFTGP